MRNSDLLRALCAFFFLIGFGCAAHASGERSLFSPSDTPATETVDDPNAVELGVKFVPWTNGAITGVRFYKGPQNIGTHVAHLWSGAGATLASATFTNESASGWQTVLFAQPVAVSAGALYVASYHTSGNYSATYNYFGDMLTNAPLSAPATQESDGNGVYAYGAAAFPTNSFGASNYWVDVLFTPAPATGAPVIVSRSTASASAGLLFKHQVMASNEPTSFSATGLPPGVAIDPATGLISGIPETAGSYTVQLHASNAQGSGAATLGVTVTTTAANRAAGLWSPVIPLPLVPTSGAVLPNGKALLWAADGEFNFSVTGRVSTTLFDPATNTSAERTFQNGHNMFCTGTTNLADGRILANGGSNELVTTIYDPAANQSTRVQDMRVWRGYNSNTILSDGSVLTVGGSWSGGIFDKKGEVWTAASGWRMLNGLTTEPMAPAALTSFPRDSHMWLLPAGNGRVFYAGPSEHMQWLDTDGDGSVNPAGTRGDDIFASQGVAVMYERGKILKLGGARSGDGPTSNATYSIDINAGVAVNKLIPMSYPRVFANSVVLPDGEVFVMGGQTYGVNFSDSDSVLPTETWNPDTTAFRVTAPLTTPRNYHSIALLLPDGRVLSGGGGLCGVGCTANHPDVQIYSPGYLFDAAGNLKPRPQIVSAPASLHYGGKALVTTDRDVASFSLVRVASTTHTVNNDQRRLALTFTRTGPNTYEVDAPSNPGWMLPGYWMLFAIDATGTPSLSRMVRVDVNAVANMSVEPVARLSRDAAALIAPRIVKIDAQATLSATGLPAGLTFNSQTGAITGTPTVSGNFPVTIAATGATATVTMAFLIAVDQPTSAGAGLLADYFTTTNLSGAVASSRVEAPWFSDGAVGAGAGVDTTSFSARWSGEIVAQRGGVTRIQTRSDDSVRVWIGGKLVIDNWVSHAATNDEGDVDFVAGARYPIYIEYRNGAGGTALQFSWRRPGDAGFSPVPTHQLYPGTPLSAQNIALAKSASQSSTFSGATGAGMAVDGDTSGASLALTNAEPTAFWQVDLNASVGIDRVRLWNRTDCCASQLQNFYVFVSDQDMSGRSLESIQADPSIRQRSIAATSIPSNMTIPIGAAGRFVRVQSAGTDALQLAEVEVFAAQQNGPPVISGLPASLPLLFGAPVSQQITATDPEGQTVTFAASNLPAGVSLSAQGLISGAPTSLGTGTATIVATDVTGLATTAALPWTVVSGLPAVTRLVVRPAAVGATVVYAPMIANGAGASYSWDFGDGSPATEFSAAPNASHVFATAGVRRVTLTLRALSGAQTTYSVNQAIYAPVAGSARPRSSGGSAYEAPASGDPRLWVVNPDNDSVGVINLTTFALAAEVPVGARPVSVAMHPNGDAWVVNRDSATVSIVDTTTLTVKQTVTLPRASRPYGLVFSGQNAFVTLEASESLAQITEAGALAGVAPIGASPRHLSVSASGDSFLVSRFITPPLPGEATALVRTTDATGNPVGGEVVEVNPSGAITRGFVLKHSEALDTETSARGVPNYLGAPAIAPDGASAWVPSKQDNIKRGMLRDGRNLDFQTSVRAIVSKIDLLTGREDLASRVDLDNAGVASAALFHPSGAYLFVALQTSREIAVVDTAGARELFRFTVGRAPMSLALSPDGGMLYAVNFMDRSVTRVNLWPLLMRGQNEVTGRTTIRTIVAERLTARVLRGKQLFYDAADPRLARDGYLSCAACHDNAEHDGRVWDFTGFGEGLRNTISIEGRAGVRHGFQHWSANFDEVQDFEGQIRSFAEGTGLMSDASFNTGTRAQPLGDPKARVSADLDALAAYLASRGMFPESPWRAPDGALTPAAAAGQAVFATKGCATCHAGAKMTISGDATRLRNVGTIKPSSGSRLGAALTGIDVPTLLGAFATAPYLHDGSARTLEEAVQAHSTAMLNATESANIAAYLKQIGGAP